MSESLVSELRAYIQIIFKQYNPVPYHNFEHAYHVTIGANKLLDLMLHEGQAKKCHKTYGLKSDPLAHLALLFSALVHDVEHQGVPNRQLVLESDGLALLYNDQSVAEQRSLAIAFAELTKDDYKCLRSVLFEDVSDYRRFRKTVINLVLTTDIASPERTQVVKSKWKEAFGDRIERVRNGDEDADDFSETSTSMTPESCEGFEHVFETPPPLSGSSSDNCMAATTRTAQHEFSSVSARLSVTGGTPPQRKSVLPPFLSQDSVSRHRAVSSEDCREMGDKSNTLEEKRARGVARRFSMPTSAFDMRTAHIRLGIRRSLDLTGETIESYIEPASRLGKADANSEAPEVGSDSVSSDPDESDELCASGMCTPKYVVGHDFD